MSFEVSSGLGDTARPAQVLTATDQYRVAAEHFDLLIGDAWRYLRPVLAAALTDVDATAGPVLDIGAGTGIGSRTIAELVPAADIVAVEPSPSLRVGLFTRLADDPDLRSRITVLPGAALDVELPERISGAVAMNMIGHLSPEERAELWQRLAERLAPGAPLVVNLQPPARVEAVPETDFASVTAGRRTYRGRGSARPDGDARVIWTMTYQVVDGLTVVGENTAEYQWWVLDEEGLAAELRTAGLTCDTGNNGLFVARR